MINFKPDQGFDPSKNKWITDSFVIRRMQIDYVDSVYEIQEIRDSFQHYSIEYDTQINVVDNALILRLLVKVNESADFPGYKLDCHVQNDYIFADSETRITREHIHSTDLEYFTNDLFETLHDHILSLTEWMPAGQYFLPPPDIGGAIQDQIDELMD